MSRRSNGVKLYPTSAIDRVLVWTGIGGGLVGVSYLTIADDAVEYSLIVMVGLASAFNLVMAYAFQDHPKLAESAEYAQMVGQLDKTRKVLETLSAFLEGERLRVNQAEQTVSRLQGERAALEPVVTTQRETVEAILSAHASTIRTHAWKERLMGFGLGVLSSLVAGAILYASGVGR